MKFSQLLFSVLLVLIQVFATQTKASFSNYSSVLLGDRASGMGGAFTSLSNDPSAVFYYNPAALSLMKGHSISTAVSVYHKYDSKFGDGDNTNSALNRVNQGSFKSIPSASGSILSFGHFAFGLSVIVPDHNFYSGQVSNSDDNVSTLFISDQSLWVGMGFGKNLTEKSSIGLSVYYTSLDSQTSIEDQSNINSSTETRQFLEERTRSNNSLIYNLGYLYRPNENWSYGINIRSPSLEISGKGSYYSSSLDTSTGSNTADIVYEDGVKTDMRLPAKVALGLSHTFSSGSVLSSDLVFHAPLNYYDFDSEKSYARLIERRGVMNLHIGYEKPLNSVVKLRLGIYSNNSAHKEISDNNLYEPEHINMWGFSANFSVFTSDKASFTFGGYYSGGTGYSKQFINNQYEKTESSKQVFSMLISSGYVF